MFGPVLRGKLVTLRPLEESDMALCVEWFSDMEVTRYLGVRTSALALFQEEEWSKKTGESANDVLWMIEAEGRTVGIIGIHDINWQSGHAHTGINIGVKSAWGKGYASEAMALRTEYAFRWLDLHKLMTTVLDENVASKRALMRSGYKEIGKHREHFWRVGRWHDVWLGEVLRSEWEAISSAGRG